MKIFATSSKKAVLGALAGSVMALVLLPGCSKKPAPAPVTAKPAVTGVTGTKPGGTNGGTNVSADFVSVFDDRNPPENPGRDPFNPDSTRRNPAPPPTPKNVVAAGPVDVQLKLQGVAGSPGRRVATINNHIFFLTDPPEAVHVAGGGTVVVKVVEIGEDYADVMIEGTPGKKRLTMKK